MAGSIDWPARFGLTAEQDSPVAEDAVYFNMVCSIQEIERRHGPGVWVELPRMTSRPGGGFQWAGEYLPDAAFRALTDSPAG